MKTIKLIAIGMLILIAGAIQAQVSVSLNIGPPPAWGPSEAVGVQYYYLPDVEAYYDVRASMFIYQSGGLWVHRTYLPRRYRNYDLYGGYKVVMNDYHGNAPYANFKDHQRNYGRGYHGPRQQTYGQRPGNGHPSKDMHQNKVIKREPVHDNDRMHKQGNNKPDKPGNIKANKPGNNKMNRPENDRDYGKDKGHKNGHGDKK